MNILFSSSLAVCFLLMYCIVCCVHHFKHSLLQIEFFPSPLLSICFSTENKFSSQTNPTIHILHSVTKKKWMKIYSIKACTKLVTDIILGNIQGNRLPILVYFCLSVQNCLSSRIFPLGCLTSPSNVTFSSKECVSSYTIIV